jgi:2-polyprenyl-3-methyl-5-hydroxy-6-metoxy-1,4-benzoquinol methylase
MAIRCVANHWNRVYQLPIGEIPWEISTPPKDLIELLSGYPINRTACALDVACGTGNYARHLASRGFRVTGIDISSAAIAIARSTSVAAGMEVDYLQGDATHLSSFLAEDQRFDLIVDYSLLHHLSPDAFARHAKQFASRLKPQGRLLVVCYSDSDPYSQGCPSAHGKLGNQMYYRSRASIDAAYQPLKTLSYKETTLGKQNHHRGHCFVFGHERS